MRRSPAWRLIALGGSLVALAGGILAPAGAAAQPKPDRRPLATASGDRPPALAVSGAVLVAADTGQQLYGVRARAELPIASTTKLMTALVTLQHIHRLGTVFTQNDWRPATADSQIGLLPGERMSVHDLLVALMLPSADDAAEDLAYNVGHRSVRRFISMMNAEAGRLHLTRTHYSTPIGLDTPGNHSSPADLVRLAVYLRAHSPFLRRVMAMPSATLTTGRYRRLVINRNDLVRRFGWINGVKTGHTADAGYVLVASGTRHGLTLVDSVLGTSSESVRDASALALLDYGFAHFHMVEAIRRDQVLARLPVQDSSGRATVISERRHRLVVPTNARLRIELHLPRQLVGPLRRHAVVGHALVFAGRHREARIPLVLARALPAVSPVTKAARFLARPTTLLWLMLAAAAVLVYTAARRRRRPPKRRHRPPAGGRVEEGQQNLNL